MLIHLKNKDKLIVGGFKFKCCIGKSGTKKNKIEGDNYTPKGTFTFGTLYYRKDRVNKPFTKSSLWQFFAKISFAKNKKKKIIIKKSTDEYFR